MVRDTDYAQTGLLLFFIVYEVCEMDNLLYVFFNMYLCMYFRSICLLLLPCALDICKCFQCALLCKCLSPA
jgi:hypothetical protein